MNRIFVLAKRELKHYFDSPIAYIIIIVFLLISGWMFSSTIFLLNRITIDNFIYNVPLLLMFLSPAIAMQLLAGEFQCGTMEILGSLPLKDSEIILGKYFAAVILLIIAILCTFIFPVSISFFGDIDWGQVSGAYFGMVAIGILFLTAGLFASAISMNQVAAFIIGFVICFSLFIMGKFAEIMPPHIRSLMMFIGIDSHWDNIARGVIDLRDFLYFISVILFFYYSALIAFTKRVRIGFYKAASMSLLVGILVLVNLLVRSWVIRLDLTENNIYSLSKASKDVVRNISDNLIIRAYFSKNLPAPYQANREYLENMLHEYKAYSGSKVTYKFYDPYGNDEIAREAMINGIPPLKFTEYGKEKFEIKQGYMGLVILFGEKKEVLPVVNNIDGLEYDLTTRIKKITSDSIKTVAYSGDFNMPEITLQNINKRYNFVDLNKEELNKNELISLIVNADSNFDEDDLMLVSSAAKKGISIAIFADKYKVNMDTFYVSKFDNPIKKFLNEYGIEIGDGLINDRQSQRITITSQSGFFTIQNVIDYPYFPMVHDLSHDTPMLRDLRSLVFPFVSPIVIKSTKNTNIDLIAETSNESWLNADPGYLSPMTEHPYKNNSKKGPFPVICMLTSEDPVFRMVVISNTRMINKQFLSTQANEGFFLNVIDWLSEDMDLISIRSKGIMDRPITDITHFKKVFFQYVNILLMPLIVLGIGIYRWKTRELRSLKKEHYYMYG